MTVFVARCQELINSQNFLNKLLERGIDNLVSLATMPKGINKLQKAISGSDKSESPSNQLAKS